MGYAYTFILVIASVISLRAEDRADFSGTWVNARFSESISRSRSLEQAQLAVEFETPVWVSIDTERGLKSARVSFNAGKGEDWNFELKVLENKGNNWVLSDASGPRWLVSVDAQNHLFILLHRLDDQSAAPIVLSRIPSRVQDPAVLMDQIITKAILAGRFVDANGTLYEFRQDMTVDFGGKPMRFALNINTSTGGVFALVSDVQGAPSPFMVVRKDQMLELTDRTGKKITLVSSQ